MGSVQWEDRDPKVVDFTLPGHSIREGSQLSLLASDAYLYRAVLYGQGPSVGETTKCHPSRGVDETRGDEEASVSPPKDEDVTGFKRREGREPKGSEAAVCISALSKSRRRRLRFGPSFAVQSLM